jgi:protein-S-isoprenylcysteine O-methyltransferase Ste14
LSSGAASGGPTRSNRGGGDAPTPDSPGVIAFPPLLFAIPFASGALLELLVPIHILPHRLALVLGAALAAVSLAQAAAAAALMRRAGTEINPMRPTTALVVTGPFRYTRNPLYVSLTGLYVGGALLLNALWPLLLLPVALLLVERGVIEREEVYLERKFGDAYRAYRARVRRWL